MIVIELKRRPDLSGNPGILHIRNEATGREMEPVFIPEGLAEMKTIDSLLRHLERVGEIAP